MLGLQTVKLKTGLEKVGYRETAFGHLVNACQSKTGWAFTNATGTVVAHPAPTEDPMLAGSNCIRVVTSTSGDSTVLNLGHNFATVDGWTIAIYWPHADGAVTFTVSLATSTNLTNSHSFKHYATQGLNYIRLHRGSPTATNGTIDYSDLRRMSITAASADKTFYLLWVRAGLYFRPKLMIGADDEYVNNLTVLQPLMDEYGFGDKGYLAWAKYFDARDASYMTKAQVRTLRDLGWDILNHSELHVDHENASVETIYGDYERNRDYMLSEGLDNNGSCNIVVYPFGGGTSGVQANHETAMRMLGAPMARCVRRGNMTTSDNPCWDTPLSVAANPFKCKIINPYVSYKDGATVIAEIKEMIAYGGSAWLMLHSTPEAAAGDSENPLVYYSGDIEIILAWLNKNRSAVDVVRPSEFLAGIGTSRQTPISTTTYSGMPVTSKIWDVENSPKWTDDGSTAAAVGTAVQRVDDLVGSTAIANTTAGQKPTLRSGTNNGKAFQYLEFAGTDDHLATASLGTIAQPYHVVCVAQISTLNTGANQAIFDGIATGNRAMLYKNATEQWGSTAGTVITNTNDVPDTNWHIFELVTAGNRTRLIIDGVSYQDNNGVHTLTGLTMANRWDAGSTPQGGNINVAYLGLWTIDHQITGWMERHRAYLADRFGISLVQAAYDYR